LLLQSCWPFLFKFKKAKERSTKIWLTACYRCSSGDDGKPNRQRLTRDKQPCWAQSADVNRHHPNGNTKVTSISRRAKRERRELGYSWWFQIKTDKIYTYSEETCKTQTALAKL
jgi:hypothetical protein